MKQLDFPSGSRTLLCVNTKTFSYSGVWVCTICSSTRVCWKPNRLKRWNQKQTNLLSSSTKIKISKLHVSELNYLEIRNRCLQMTSFSTAPRCKCLFIVLILLTVEGTLEFRAWKMEDEAFLQLFPLHSVAPEGFPYLSKLISYCTTASWNENTPCLPRDPDCGKLELVIEKKPI